ncbi:hypothetical protein RhoFasGS6_05031 [Rhodococcus fascians]|nr:hypothetical protein [Rhodococcus fascians]
MNRMESVIIPVRMHSIATTLQPVAFLLGTLRADAEEIPQGWYKKSGPQRIPGPHLHVRAGCPLTMLLEGHVCLSKAMLRSTWSRISPPSRAQYSEAIRSAVTIVEHQKRTANSSPPNIDRIDIDGSRARAHSSFTRNQTDHNSGVVRTSSNRARVGISVKSAVDATRLAAKASTNASLDVIAGSMDSTALM